MLKFSRWSWVFLALAMAAVLAASFFKPRLFFADAVGEILLDQAVPKKFAGWEMVPSSLVQITSPDQLALINELYSQTLTRTYRSPDGYQVMLSLAYGRDQRDAKSAHRPEVCYPAQGFNILKQSNQLLKDGEATIAVKRLLAERPGRQEPITYWIMVGEQVATWGKSRGAVNMTYGVRGLIPDGVVFRISSIDSDYSRAQAVHDDFARALRQAVDQAYQKRLFGY